MTQQTFRQGGNQPQVRPTTELPVARPVRYFDAGGNLRAELVDEEAMECAKKFREISSSQLRRFYEHVTGLRRRLDECPDNERSGEFEKLRPEFKMLKAKAAYTASRDNRARTALQPLLQFFIDHTAAVATERDFRAFCKHFEAVIAFHKFYAEKEQ